MSTLIITSPTGAVVVASVDPRSLAFSQGIRAGDYLTNLDEYRLVYGGIVISLARALSFNGLGNAFHVAAINGGRHVAPCFAGDTIYAWSEVRETAELPGRADLGALRVRLMALKNRPAAGFPLKTPQGDYEDDVILDLDVWLLIPR